MAKAKTKQQLALENDELRVRLQEMEETLEAIRSGAVDAIVASGPAGDRVYTLEGADHAYHMMVESMNQGAVTLQPDGTILYGNSQFVQLTGSAPSGVVGRHIHDFVHAADRQALDEIIGRARSNSLKAEIRLIKESAAEIPVQIAASPIDLGGSKALILVLTDLTVQKRFAEIVAAEKLSRLILQQAQEAIAVCIKGCIVRANRALYEICGSYPLMQPFDLVLPLRMSESEMFSLAMPESGKTVREREVLYHRPDGRVFNLILSAGPLVGRDSKVLGTLITLLDITEIKQAEASLEEARKSLEHERDLLQSVMNGATNSHLVYLDRDFNFVRVNETYAATCGYKPEEMIGKNHFALYPHAENEAIFARVRDTGIAAEFHDKSFVFPDQPERGVTHWDWTLRPAQDDAGSVIGLIFSLFETTERKQSEEALKRSFEQIDLLINNLPGYAFFKDANLRYVMLNNRACRLLGRPIEDIVGKDDFELFPARLAEKYAADDRLVLESGEPLVVENEKNEEDGKPVILSTRKVPIKDGSGKVTGLIGLSIDITDRKRVEEALRESRAKMQAAFASLTDAIFIADAEGRLIDYNEGFVRYHRFKDREECSRTIADCPHYLDAYFQDGTPAPPEMWAMPRALQGETASDVEYMLRRKDTDETWWGSYNFAPIKDEDGRIIGAVVAGREITDRKQAETALKEAKESLELRVQERTIDLQNLTERLEQSRHELRNLASELVMAEERERKRIAGVLHDDIAQLLAAARMRLSLLQQDIPSNQNKTLEEAKSLVLESLRETRTLMHDLGNPVLFDMGLKAAGESLADRLMERHPVRIRCDIREAYKHLDADVKTILYQVVRELLTNVVKHSHAQNALVVIDQENGHFQVKVTDDGVGFDPQALGPPTAEGGFGLFSIRERLIAMDGSLRIESTPGGGTVVTVVLPAALGRSQAL